jgi:hypothetical protein
MLLSGLYALVNPKAVKKENEDVTGFYKTGFSWVPVWGWRLFGIVLLAVSGFFLYLSLRHSLPQAETKPNAKTRIINTRHLLARPPSG